MTPNRLRKFSMTAAVVVGGVLAVGAVIPSARAQAPSHHEGRGSSSDPQGTEIKVRAARPVAEREVRPGRAPAALTVAQKQRELKSMLMTLQRQHLANRNLQMDRVFPLGLSADSPTDLHIVKKKILTVTQPVIPGLAMLVFYRPLGVGAFPEVVGPTEYRALAEWSEGGSGDLLLQLYRSVVPTTYLLDFTLESDASMEIKIWRGSTLPSLEMELPVVNGHVLVPYTATEHYWVSIHVKSTAKWKFYSVEIDTVE